MASVNSYFYLGPVLLESQGYRPTKDEIEQAKADLFDFLVSGHAESIMGQSLSELKDHLLRARSEYKIPLQRFDNVMGELFASLIDQAVAAEILDASVSKVFYGDIDRVAFLESVATDLIAYVIVQERMQPVLKELDPEHVRGAYAELVQYICADFLVKFKSQVRAIMEESSGNFDLAYYHQDPQLPSFSSILAKIIREGVRTCRLSPSVREIFFSKVLDRKEFVRNLIAEIMRS